MVLSDSLILSNLKYAQLLAFKAFLKYNKTIPLDELKSIANLELTITARRYKSSHSSKARYWSYAQHRIKGALASYCAKCSRDIWV